MAYAPGVNLGPPQSLVTPIAIATINPASTPTTTTVTVVGLPVGTKAIGGRFAVASSTVGDQAIIREYGTAVNRDVQQTQVANNAIFTPFVVRVDTTFRFDVYASNLNISAIDIVILTYYMGG
jgi:hypothetical protein